MLTCRHGKSIAVRCQFCIESQENDLREVDPAELKAVGGPVPAIEPFILGALGPEIVKAPDAG